VIRPPDHAPTEGPSLPLPYPRRTSRLGMSWRKLTHFAQNIRAPGPDDGGPVGAFLSPLSYLANELPAAALPARALLLDQPSSQRLLVWSVEFTRESGSA
jgi:hypothetical protein